MAWSPALIGMQVYMYVTLLVNRTLWSVKGNIFLVYLRYLAHTSTVIGGHLHFLAGVPVVYVIYHTNISQYPIYKILHPHLEWAIYGDICQMYTRIWQLHRNLLIFVPIRKPNTCQVFGSQYSQVKLEGPLHIPGIYQNVLVWDLLAYTWYMWSYLAYSWYKMKSFKEELVYLSTQVIFNML